MIRLFGLLAFLLPIMAQAQQYTISGRISSATTGETLPGTVVKLADGSVGTVSNEYGFYSLTLKAGPRNIDVSAIGLQPVSFSINLSHDTTINVELGRQPKDLKEVVITSKSKGRDLAMPQTGVEKLSVNDIKTIPVLLGEKDVIKVAQLLPGIKSAGDGNSGFYVRGGSGDQNLIQLDEATVYNASHLLGFFSTFNSDAIKDVTIYKSGMPAQYGGRLSSVMDVRMNDGNNKDYNVSGGIGLISSRLNIEGPIQKDKSSFLVSGRRTYADMFLALSDDPRLNNNTLYFYDLNAKMNYSLGAKDRIYLSGYFGKDKLGVGETFGLAWGNSTGTARWNHIFNNKLFSNTSLIYSNYDYTISIQNGGNNFNIFSQIRDYNIKEDLSWYPNNANSVKVGFSSIYHTIRPGEITASDESAINDLIQQKRHSLENAIFATNTWKASPRISVTYGVRLTAFTVLGAGDFYEIDNAGQVADTLSYQSGQAVKTYINPEPRVALSYSITENSSIKTSYARNIQNLHLISNSTSSNPTDKWVASTNNIKPEISDQVSLGWYKDLKEGAYELTIESYYKAMQNQIDYRNGANVFSSSVPIDAQLLYGVGRAYGIEFLIKKKVGAFTGWVGYTLSKTERKINGINDNKWYNARQDRTHDIAVVGMYELNKKWSFSANWIYYTGDAITFPTGKYRVDGRTVYYYTDRNGYRMPNYHRLDIGATWTMARGERKLHELMMGVYNLYGRENAYVIDFRDSETQPGQTEVVQTALFKYIPSITYNFKF
ncbi:MAG: TonB-dependent receptor [Taibaiella sp.]|nr:TonB-dependent receptor [Taibaiella sp.]